MTAREPAATDDTLRVHLPPPASDGTPDAAPVPGSTAGARRRWGVLDRGGIRTRILVWYLVLLTLSIVIAIVGLRQILVTRLTADIDAALAQEVEELRVLATGIDPASGEPFGSDVTAILDTFLQRSVPGEYEAFYTVVDGRPHKRTVAPISLFDDATVFATWRAATEPTWGRTETAAGPVRWLAAPLEADGSRRGLFAVVHHEADQREDIDTAVQVMILMSVAVLILGSVLAWGAAGRAIAPLRSLTATARGIGDRDLSARIPVESSDEVGELTEQINSMLERLEAAFSSQRNFLNDVGHELRTPITIARGHLELLDDDPVERRRTLDLVIDELDRMGRYVSDLLVIARAEQPDFLTVRPVEIAQFVDGLLARVAPLAERSWRAETPPSIVIVADPDRLAQALVNLVTNAVRHTDPGAVIELGVRLEGGEVRMWVRDEGTGIEPEDQRRIFDRFAQGRAPGRRQDGVGLGLAIVEAIVHAHGGRVELESAPGLGSTFSIVIPVVPPMEAPES
jgi:signal transduction histidine kinase